MAAEDDENPSTSEQDWGDATVGLPPSRASASLDADVVDWFKAQDARTYQARMSAVLRRYIEARRRHGR